MIKDLMFYRNNQEIVNLCLKMYFYKNYDTIKEDYF